MLGGAALGATHARAGVTLPRRSRGPNRETIRGMGHGSNSDQGRRFHCVRISRTYDTKHDPIPARFPA